MEDTLDFLNQQSTVPLVLNGFDAEGLFAQLEMNFEQICPPLKKVSFVQQQIDSIDTDEEPLEPLAEPAEPEASLDSENEMNEDKEMDSISEESDLYTGADDEFFSMKEMNHFAKQQEAMDEDLQSESEEEEEEENVDYENLTFNDFFDDKSEQLNSRYAKEQDRLMEKILDIEKNKLQNYLPESKPMALKGEVNAKDRQKNDLLHFDLEHDTAKRPMPDTDTFNIDNLIKERIANKVFDNLERKMAVDTTHIQDPTTMGTKSTFNVEQHTQKSEKTLAQVYEEEYRQKENDDLFGTVTNKERPKEHLEIESMWNTIEETLNSLTNNFYRPKSYSTELMIEDQTNIISREDIQPAALLEDTVDDVKLKSHFKNDNELNQSDKQRLRRKKQSTFKNNTLKKALINKVLDASKPKSLKKERKDVLSELVKSSSIMVTDRKGSTVSK